MLKRYDVLYWSTEIGEGMCHRVSGSSHARRVAKQHSVTSDLIDQPLLRCVPSPSNVLNFVILSLLRCSSKGSTRTIAAMKISCVFLGDGAPESDTC